MHTAMSVLRDLSFGSPGMNPVTEMMKSDPLFASGISKTLADVRDKPIIRCENCTKTPEEIGSGKFMVCSSCKSKLDFIIHYCSQFVNYCSVFLLHSLLTAFVGHARKKTGPIIRSTAVEKKMQSSFQVPLMTHIGSILSQRSFAPTYHPRMMAMLPSTP
jgi:hypothetical protein